MRAVKSNNSKPKILFFNLVNHSSTGNICKNISKCISDFGYDSYFIWGFQSNIKNISNNEYIIGKSKNRIINFCKRGFIHFYNKLLYRYIGDGFSGYEMFYNIKKILNKEKPDVIHMHNMHGSNFPLPLIIKYSKKHNIPIVYTMHDCWLFTGCCPHFLISGCNKYLTNECNKCDYINRYPTQRRDIAHKCYKKKYKAFNSYNNITFVGVSGWLTLLCQNSPITGKHRCITINNGINTSIFSPRIDIQVLKRYGIPNERYILAISPRWSAGKGLQFLNILSKRLNDINIRFVVIGDVTQIVFSKKTNIIGRVYNPNDLAVLYSMADIMVNLSLEDSFPTTILESVACHTPVVSFDTGGCKEAINGGGIVVPRGDIDKLIEETIKLFHNNNKDKFIYKPFVANEQYQKYLDLYNELIKEKKDGKQTIKQ